MMPAAAVLPTCTRVESIAVSIPDNKPLDKPNSSDTKQEGNRFETTKKVFWRLFVIGLICGAVFDLTKLIIQFSDNPVSTDLDFKFKEPISGITATFCVPNGFIIIGNGQDSNEENTESGSNKKHENSDHQNTDDDNYLDWYNYVNSDNDAGPLNKSTGSTEFGEPEDGYDAAVQKNANNSYPNKNYKDSYNKTEFKFNYSDYNYHYTYNGSGNYNYGYYNGYEMKKKREAAAVLDGGREAAVDAFIAKKHDSKAKVVDELTYAGNEQSMIVMEMLRAQFSFLTLMEAVGLDRFGEVLKFDPTTHLVEIVNRDGSAKYMLNPSVMLKLRNYLERHGFTLPELRQLLGQRLVELMDIRMTFAAQDRSYAYVPTKMTDISHFMTCFKIPLPTLADQKDLVKLTCKQQSRRFGGIDFTSFDSVYYLDVLGRPRLSSEALIDIVIQLKYKDIDPFGVQQLWYQRHDRFSIRGLYILLPERDTGGYKCTNERTRTECQHRCRSQLISKLCGCIPTSIGEFSNREQELQACSYQHYEQCNLAYDGDSDSDCRLQCLKYCTVWDYEFENMIKTAIPERNFTYSSYTYIVGETPAEMILSAKHTNYPVFSESKILTWQNFVGNFGGIMGFWLGASLIGFVELARDLLEFIFTKLHCI